MQARAEARSAASVEKSLHGQLEELRNEVFLLRQRAAPLAADAADADAIAPAAGGGERGAELEVVDARAAAKAARAEVQYLQKEVVSRKADVAHHAAMAAEFEANWKQAEERLRSERAALEARPRAESARAPPCLCLAPAAAPVTPRSRALCERGRAVGKGRDAWLRGAGQGGDAARGAARG